MKTARSKSLRLQTSDMSSSFDSSPPVSILAVIVLYKRAPAESQSLSSLVQFINTCEDLSKHLSLLVYDNSPHPIKQQITLNCAIEYQYDETNGGLATAYNFALERAFTGQHEWLLLLDQDTSLTLEFLRELIVCSTSLRNQDIVASIVPKLLVGGEVYSPVRHFIDQLRHQYQRTNHAVSPRVTGIQLGRLCAYNSGAAIRVSALQAIGGFPQEFWLDYLDHAVFHSLSAQGNTMYVMQAAMTHESSQATMSCVPAWRQRNLLIAQTRFVMKAGAFLDRSLLYRIWLLRYARTLWLHHPDRRLWKEALIEAVTLRSVAKTRSADLQPLEI